MHIHPVFAEASTLVIFLGSVGFASSVKITRVVKPTISLSFWHGFIGFCLPLRFERFRNAAGGMTRSSYVTHD
jgi:hypothetical protein